jgi:hypothetical protein
MGRAVGPHQPRAVDGEADGKALDRDVMHDLVIAALQEGRIDRGEGFQAARGHARAHGDRVLFGDAHVEGALGKRSPNRSRPVPSGIAAVTATILGSSSASRIRARAKTLV